MALQSQLTLTGKLEPQVLFILSVTQKPVPLNKFYGYKEGSPGKVINYSICILWQYLYFIYNIQ